MLAVKRSSLFFIKGLKFFSFLINSKYLAIFNYFNVIYLPSIKGLTFFFFSSSFVYFFFKNLVFFKFLNPFCLVVFPFLLNDFFGFFKEFSSDLFLVGFSFDFFFFNSRFFLNLDFFGIDFIFIFIFFFKYFYFFYGYFFFFFLNFFCIKFRVIIL
jgi:hypothetical protein